MPTVIASPALHRRALDAVTDLLAGLTPADLDRPSPCAGWDLRQLLAHMVGQNHGFAAAAEHDVDVAAFADRAVDEDPGRVWAESATLVADALAAAVAVDGRTILLPEFASYGRLPAPFVLGMQQLDTVVHGWDVATALGVPYRPDDELVATTLELARAVPGGAAREQPGASFAPAVTGDTDDPWVEALRLLGRDPGQSGGRS
jgi:uncharacterized protein (TIGR03086 family)